MKKFSLCYFGARALEVTSLSQAVLRFRESGGKIGIYARTASQLFDEARVKSFVRKAMASDIVVVTLFGERKSCPAFEDLISSLAEARQSGKKIPYFHVQPVSPESDSILAAEQHSDGFGSDAWNTINLYHNYAGAVNFHQMLLYFCNLLFQENLRVEPPCKLPYEGIYHPDFSSVPDLNDYLERRYDPEKPTVGLWFYQALWLGNDLEHIDAIIREIERQGANVIPVFHLRRKDPVLGNQGPDYIIDHFFMENGKSRIDVLINPMPSSLTLESVEWATLLPRLGVPCIQAMAMMRTHAVWKEGMQGLSAMDLPFLVAQPEFDGTLITVPIATKEETTTDPVTGAILATKKPIPDRIQRMVSIALKWAALRRKPNSEKKIAIVFHNYPPRNDRIGSASGLDSFASVKNILDHMASRSYRIDRTYQNGDELAQEMLNRMTCDRRWLTPDRMAQRAEAHADREHFLRWYETLPASVQKKMTEDWGQVPGELFVHNDQMHFPGIINGNIFLTIQPPRGDLDKAAQNYHDMFLSPPHHYLAHYRWIREVFKADAVMHIGKHGTLEWLPGKSVGLSEECYPDLAIMDLPNVYPYIINDPSEGTQAKRRSYCCIVDHLTPAMANAELYEELAEVETALRDYKDAKREDSGKVSVLRPLMWAAVVKADLDKDLHVTESEAMAHFDAFVEQVDDYLEELGDTTINDGLHILGTAPVDGKLSEFVTQLTRLPNGDIPSLRESIIKSMGFDYNQLLKNRGKKVSSNGDLTGGEIMREAHLKALQMVNALDQMNYDPTHIDRIIEQTMDKPSPEIRIVLEYVAESLVPNIRLVTNEINSILTAFEGGFVLPGPSGAPTRGQADILPTGRNFFTLDPRKIPSRAAWEVGKKLGDSLLARYLTEKGKYPESIGMILWGGSTMRSKGDDVAEILYLMGVRPIWNDGNGNVVGVEIIPAAELNRPRLDVVPRTSGFFRDAFPNIMKLIDDAVRMVAALNEPPEINILRRNVMRDMKEHIKEGMTEEEAWREATFRVFSCPPGTYGAGVKDLVETKNWKTQQDLGNAYIRYSSHVYGDGSYGKQKPAVFKRILSRVDATFKNEDSREKDMLCCTDYYNYYGGLISAVNTVRGDLPFAVVGDSSDPQRIMTRTTFEEAQRIFRARLLNPKWLEGLKRHGYKGAGEISKAMDIVMGWDATAEVVDDWMYERLATKFALDSEMQAWMKEVNPYALQNILDKLLEAISRGMWKTSQDTEEKLRNEYLELEGNIEELTE